MQNLLNFREKVKTFVDKHNLFLRCVGRFLLTMILIYSANQIFQSDILFSRIFISIVISVISIFVPFSYLYLIFLVICCIHAISISADALILLLIFNLVIYVIYNRCFTQYGYLTILTFVLLPTKLSAMIPLFIGIFAGPTGIPPMLIGIFVYYYAMALNDVMQNITKTIGTYQLYQLVIDAMISNKELTLCLLSFVITLLFVRQLYRAKFNYAWFISIPISGIIYAVIYLYGSFLYEMQSSIVDVIISFVLSVIVLEILQFFREVVDYSRVENLQFEDDEYYYFVKAVPKIKVSQEEFNVKRINTQRKSLIHRKERKE